ncbi:lysylphosphatidylglycerol synthase transmembrane domain-containing protein [Thermotoga profunda]|uniref:lysylphosphatidylglycerol synthase transmembrane domain-containing protein n=1 Tax=Thermotoga profunda TaxID=1508420 RepID=UPI000597243E|nr:lysylphosphatidylglycerol synthase transmembrane domain-containing protein [Thermotoga profunda]
MRTKILIGVILSLGMTALISLFGAKESLLAAFKSIDLRIFSIACCAYFIFMLIDALRTKILLSHNGLKVSYLLCFQNTVLGLYTSAITPFSAGGQPFQIYHLVKNNISIERSSMAIGVKFITSLTLMITTSFFLILFRGKKLISDNSSAFMVYAGLILTSAIYVFFLLLILSKNFTYRIFTSKFLTKVISRLTKKDIQLVLKKTVDSLSNYFELLKNLWTSSKILLLVNVFLTGLEILLTMSVPYILVLSFGFCKVNYLEFLAAILAMTMVVYFLPTPGSSGGVEGAFYIMFKNLISRDIVVATVITWRLITYYTMIALGTLLLSKMLLTFKQTKP